MAKFIENSHPETSAIKERQSKLDTACERVKESAEKRLRKLKVCILTSGHIVYYYNYCFWKESQALCEFMLQVEEEEAWIKEKEALCSSMDFGKDLNTVMLSQQKHKVLEEDIEGREPHFKSLCEKGITVIQLELDKCLFLFNAWKPKVLCTAELCPILINDYFKGLKLKVADVLMRPSTSSSSFEKAAASRFKLLEKQSSRPDIMQNKTVQNRVLALKEKWDKMKDLLSQRRTKLEEAIQSQQVKISIDHYHSLLRFFSPFIVSCWCRRSRVMDKRERANCIIWWLW